MEYEDRVLHLREANPDATLIEDIAEALTGFTLGFHPVAHTRTARAVYDKNRAMYELSGWGWSMQKCLMHLHTLGKDQGEHAPIYIYSFDSAMEEETRDQMLAALADKSENKEPFIQYPYERALLGLAMGCGPARLAYDYHEIVLELMGDMEQEAAEEFVDFNTAGGYLGVRTPEIVFQFKNLEGPSLWTPPQRSTE